MGDEEFVLNPRSHQDAKCLNVTLGIGFSYPTNPDVSNNLWVLLSITEETPRAHRLVYAFCTVQTGSSRFAPARGLEANGPRSLTAVTSVTRPSIMSGNLTVWTLRNCRRIRQSKVGKRIINIRVGVPILLNTHLSGLYTDCFKRSIPQEEAHSAQGPLQGGKHHLQEDDY